MKIKMVGGGVRRSFELAVGLRQGYGDSAVTHTVAEVVDLVVDHLKSRVAAGKVYLTGTVVLGEVAYAWPEGPGKAGGGHEPIALYQGEVSPLYNAETTDEEAVQILTDLAGHLAEALGQTRVYLVYRETVTVFQMEDTVTPTGETV